MGAKLLIVKLFYYFTLDGDCYIDSSSRILPNLKKDDKNKMTPELCKKICFQDNDFLFAGVQHSHECFCGNAEPPLSKLAYPQSQCNMRCTGDSSKMCGGVWRINVFKRGKIN